MALRTGKRRAQKCGSSIKRKVSTRMRINQCHTFDWSRKLWREAAGRISQTVAVLVCVYLTVVVMLSWYAGLRGVDIPYFIAATLTTIGIGDISPQTTFFRACTIFILPSGLIIISFGISLSVSLARSKPPEVQQQADGQDTQQEQEQQQQQQQLSPHLGGAWGASSVRGVTRDVLHECGQWYESLGLTGTVRERFLVVAAKYVGVVLVGACCMFYNEREAYLQKQKNGGAALSFVDCLYFATVVSSTVGYGHELVPLSNSFKGFLVVYFFGATCLVGSSLGELSECLLSRKANAINAQLLDNTTYLHKADVLGAGSVGQADFVLFHLQQMQKVDRFTLLRLYQRFSQLDMDRSGKLKIGVEVPSSAQVLKLQAYVEEEEEEEEEAVAAATIHTTTKGLPITPATKKPEARRLRKSTTLSQAWREQRASLVESTQLSSLTRSASKLRAEQRNQRSSLLSPSSSSSLGLKGKDNGNCGEELATETTSDPKREKEKEDEGGATPEEHKQKHREHEAHKHHEEHKQHEERGVRASQEEFRTSRHATSRVGDYSTEFTHNRLLWKRACVDMAWQAALWFLAYSALGWCLLVHAERLPRQASLEAGGCKVRQGDGGEHGEHGRGCGKGARRAVWGPYFLSATISTVGFGDVAPTLQLTRACAVFLIPFGLAIFGLVLSLVQAYALSVPPPLDGKGQTEASEDAKQLRLVFDLLDLNGDGMLDREEMTQGASRLGISQQEADDLFKEMDGDGNGFLLPPKEFKPRWRNTLRGRLVAVCLKLVGPIAVGALFMQLSGGLLGSQGDVDGGSFAEWVDALYFATVTATSVGYGDLVPQTDGARIFLTFYMLASTIVVGGALGEAIDVYVNDVQGERIVRAILDSTTWVHKADLNGKGFIVEADYVLFKLMQMQKVDSAMLDVLIDRFEELSAGNDGQNLRVGVDVPSEEQVRILKQRISNHRSQEGGGCDGDQLRTLQEAWVELQKKVLANLDGSGGNDCADYHNDEVDLDSSADAERGTRLPVSRGYRWGTDKGEHEVAAGSTSGSFESSAPPALPPWATPAHREDTPPSAALPKTVAATTPLKTAAPAPVRPREATGSLGIPPVVASSTSVSKDLRSSRDSSDTTKIQAALKSTTSVSPLTHYTSATAGTKQPSTNKSRGGPPTATTASSRSKSPQKPPLRTSASRKVSTASISIGSESGDDEDSRGSKAGKGGKAVSFARQRQRRRRPEGVSLDSAATATAAQPPPGILGAASTSAQVELV